MSALFKPVRSAQMPMPDQPIPVAVDVNVLGSMLVAQKAALAMREAGKGGSIILVASMSGTITNRGMDTPACESCRLLAPNKTLTDARHSVSLDNASKSAVLQLARSLAVEFGASDGIRVNVNPFHNFQKPSSRP